MRSRAPALAALAILVGACSSGSGPTQGAGASNEAWRTLGLRDVVSGEGFRISDLRGEASRSLAATFGDQILSPPATPVVILGPDGAVIEKHVGIKGADDLAAFIKEHLP